MFKRLVLFLFLAWGLGFVWFAMSLPQSINGKKTDAVIVLTGGEGRIARGLAVLREGLAQRLLVSGVDRLVKPAEFAAAYKIDQSSLACCITLGFQAVDTRSNAREAARWIALHKFRKVRLITSDWHMRRAALELDRMKPEGVTVVPDAVTTQPSLETLFREYHKFLARWLSPLWGA
jgi:uncharacterized SAM-binding protein YcdF (DUF218 family)